MVRSRIDVAEICLALTFLAGVATWYNNNLLEYWPSTKADFFSNNCIDGLFFHMLRLLLAFSNLAEKGASRWFCCAASAWEINHSCPAKAGKLCVVDICNGSVLSPPRLHPAYHTTLIVSTDKRDKRDNPFVAVSLQGTKTLRRLKHSGLLVVLIANCHFILLFSEAVHWNSCSRISRAEALH